MDEVKKKLSMEVSVTKKVDEDWLKVTTIIGGDSIEEFDANILAMQERLEKIRDFALGTYQRFPNTAKGLKLYEPIPQTNQGETEDISQLLEEVFELRKSADSKFLDSEGIKKVKLFEKKIAVKRISGAELQEYINILKAIQKEIPLE